MNLEEELLYAIKQKNASEVRRLVNSGANVRARRVGAADQLPLPIVIDLDRGDGIGERYPKVYCPLHLAASCGNTEVVKVLLDAGAEINFMDEKQNSSLHKAADTGNIQMVETLLERGADPNAKNLCYETPLLLATIDNNVSIVKILKQRGAELDCRNYHQDAPLHYAILKNNTKMVEILIELKADVNTQNSEGNTPLYLAVLTGNAEMVRILVEANANVNIENHYDFNMPLHLAVQGRKDPSIIIDLVTARGADVNARNHRGNTPLHLIACQDEYGDIKNTVSFIKAREIGQSRGRESSIEDIVRILMTNSADASIENKRGEVPKHDSITEFLKERSNAIRTPSSGFSNVSNEPIAGPSWRRSE